MAYVFEWDPAKAATNRRKHGVTFDEASTVFGDPLALMIADPDHSEQEDRYVLVGASVRERVLVVAFVERPPWTRLISARPATRSERRRYEAKG
ncbi:MAG: BrnT family toxin [Candidatus Rokubacteria bacterium]|nr:BrnT family toxin [Candidatus Rokubacteria bacterium]